MSHCEFIKNQPLKYHVHGPAKNSLCSGYQLENRQFVNVLTLFNYYTSLIEHVHSLLSSTIIDQKNSYQF